MTSRPAEVLAIRRVRSVNTAFGGESELGTSRLAVTRASAQGWLGRRENADPAIPGLLSFRQVLPGRFLRTEPTGQGWPSCREATGHVVVVSRSVVAGDCR